MFSSALAGCSHNIRAIHHFSLCRLCAFYQVTRVKYHCRDKSSGFRNVLSKKKTFASRVTNVQERFFNLINYQTGWIESSTLKYGCRSADGALPSWRCNMPDKFSCWPKNQQDIFCEIFNWTLEKSRCRSDARQGRWSRCGSWFTAAYIILLACVLTNVFTLTAVSSTWLAQTFILSIGRSCSIDCYMITFLASFLFLFLVFSKDDKNLNSCLKFIIF